MRTIGIIVTVIGGAAIAAAVYIGARSAPDVRRYLKMRSM